MIGAPWGPGEQEGVDLDRIDRQLGRGRLPVGALGRRSHLVLVAIL